MTSHYSPRSAEYLPTIGYNPHSPTLPNRVLGPLLGLLVRVPALKARASGVRKQGAGTRVGIPSKPLRRRTEELAPEAYPAQMSW